MIKYKNTAAGVTGVGSSVFKAQPAGADPGGPGGQDTPPPPFWGTPKLHKEGKKRCAHARVCNAF